MNRMIVGAGLFLLLAGALLHAFRVDLKVNPPQPQGDFSDAVTPDSLTDSASLRKAQSALSEGLIFGQDEEPLDETAEVSRDDIQRADPATPFTWQYVGSLTNAGRREGLFVRSGQNETISLWAGQSTEGWTLRRLTADMAVFESGGQQITLRLFAPND